MAKRPATPQESTTDSWAYEYFDERRFGKLRPVRVTYPMVDDRRAAGNIDFANETEHRNWRGKVPTVGRDLDDKQVKGAHSLDDGEFQWTSDATSTKHIGRFEIGTPSGVEALIDPPFTPGPQQGYPTDSPVQIDNNFHNDITEGEFYVLGPITTEQSKNNNRFKYYRSDGAVQSANNRMTWGITEDYQAPTEPEVRYPKKGAYKLRWGSYG